MSYGPPNQLCQDSDTAQFPTLIKNPLGYTGGGGLQMISKASSEYLLLKGAIVIQGPGLPLVTVKMADLHKAGT